MLSIVIPSRNEKYLKKTIEDLLIKAVEKIEIVAVLDGYWPEAEEIVDRPNVHYIHFTDPRGMREAINKGVALARGEYIMKSDAHCMFEQGFDKKLKTDCRDNWVVVPTRKRLDPEKWELIEGKPDIDQMYLSYPDDPSVWGGASLQGKEWRGKKVEGDIVDLMTAQGSCWFMKRDYFYYLELMDEENYGEFAKEMQEIGLKCWLSGGRMVRNRKTWYSHWHKTSKDGRGYSLNKEQWKKGTEYVKKWFDEKEVVWHKQILSLGWLINRFWPVPGWPEEYGNAKK